MTSTPPGKADAEEDEDHHDLAHQTEESDTESSETDEDSPSTPSVIRSPTKLRYRIGHLSEDSQSRVRNAFSEPPRLALQRCRLVDNTYAFQMTELVTRSVRIQAKETATPRLRCSCGSLDEPCEHLLWLLDQLVKQTLYDHDMNEPLTMNSEGFPDEIDDPFTQIADHHLDILAQGLHCEIVSSGGAKSRHEELDLHRVVEARELLAATHDKPAGTFRPDIFDHPAADTKIIAKEDLDQTIFSMLLDNNHFFHYFLSVSNPLDPIRDPFHKLSQRVDQVLRDLDSNLLSPAPRSQPVVSNPSAEGPCDVSWAARHILGCVALIRQSIFSRNRPLESREAISAARALTHILTCVIDRNHDAHPGPGRANRNIYFRLIGDRDHDFVIGVLNLIPAAASQYLHSLEANLDDIGIHGAPSTYVDKFKALLGRLRKSTAGASLKRSVPAQGLDRKAKRMK